MTYNFFNLNSMMSGFPLLGAQIFGNNFGNFNMGNFNIGNQNADLGYNIGSILCNTGCLVVNSYRTEKAAEKQADLDMDNEYKNIDDQISSTLKEIGSGYDEHNYTTAKLDSKYDTDETNTKDAFDAAAKDYNTANDFITKNKNAYDQIKDKSDEELTTDQKELKDQYKKYLKDLTNLKTENDKKEREYKNAVKAKEEAQRKLDANIRKVTELLAKRAKLENQINNRDLDKLSKKVKKGSDDVLTDKLNNNGTLKENESFDVTDFNTAVHRLMNSTRGSEERYKNAKLVSNIYKKLPETDKNSRLKKCAEIAEEEIRKHKKPDNETQGA